MDLSAKIKEIQISGIRRFYNKVMEVPGAISLTLGEPDFKVPLEVKNAMKSAIDEDKTRYTPNAGILELREEISKYLRLQSIDFEVDEICVTVGGSEGLLASFIAVLNEGDKVLVPEIAYSAYESCIKIAGGQVVNYPVNADFTIDVESIRKIINQQDIKAIVLSYPSNPTGAVLTKAQCEELYEVLREQEILIISDEMYASICFEDYYSISQYKELKDRLILVSGFSKMFSMTGLRVGYVAAPKNILSEIIKVHQYNTSCAPSIAQYGAAEGLRSCNYHVEVVKEELVRRRDYVYGRLVDMGFEVVKPKGAFYIFPSVKKFGMSSEEFCEKLLKDTKVAIVPGNAFGKGGEGYVRISYCYSIEELKKSLDLIEGWI